MHVIGRIFIPNLTRQNTDEKIKKLSIKPRLKLTFSPLFSQYRKNINIQKNK